MQIGGVAPTSWADAGTATASSFAALGKDDFLKLFLTKIQNQDPLSPTSDEQFLAQLAQFSALEQSIQANSILARIAQAQDSSASARLMDLLGRQVSVSGEIPLHVTSGVSEPLSVRIPSDASSLSVEILDASGKVVRKIDLGSRSSGVHAVGWDGCDDRGQALPDGSYTYRVKALDVKGAPISVEALVVVRIDALKVVGGEIVPLSQGRIIDLEDIQEVAI